MVKSDAKKNSKFYVQYPTTLTSMTVVSGRAVKIREVMAGSANFPLPIDTLHVLTYGRFTYEVMKAEQAQNPLRIFLLMLRVIKTTINMIFRLVTFATDRAVLNLNTLLRNLLVKII